jgi:hypothetical protein
MGSSVAVKPRPTIIGKFPNDDPNGVALATNVKLTFNAPLDGSGHDMRAAVDYGFAIALVALAVVIVVLPLVDTGTVSRDTGLTAVGFAIADIVMCILFMVFVEPGTAFGHNKPIYENFFYKPNSFLK